MKDFVILVPLIQIDNIFYPEIKISKDTILQIEYPINISCTNQNGLTHQGIGGCFSFWFKKDRKIYQILFTKNNIKFYCLNSLIETIWIKQYNYLELRKFINDINKDRTPLYN